MTGASGKPFNDRTLQAAFIFTPDGRHVFLEVNPAGEFFWLEHCPGLPVSDAIADVLLGRAPRREALS